MYPAPDLIDHLSNLIFFLLMNALTLGAAWLKSRQSQGAFRWAYFVAVAPIVVLVWALSWEWLFDVTAANLWPLTLFLLLIPCGIAWLVIFLVEQRSKRKMRRWSEPPRY